MLTEYQSLCMSKALRAPGAHNATSSAQARGPETSSLHHNRHSCDIVGQVVFLWKAQCLEHFWCYETMAGVTLGDCGYASVICASRSETPGVSFMAGAGFSACFGILFAGPVAFIAIQCHNFSCRVFCIFWIAPQTGVGVSWFLLSSDPSIPSHGCILLGINIMQKKHIDYSSDIFALPPPQSPTFVVVCGRSLDLRSLIVFCI